MIGKKSFSIYKDASVRVHRRRSVSIFDESLFERKEKLQKSIWNWKHWHFLLNKHQVSVMFINNWFPLQIKL